MYLKKIIPLYCLLLAFFTASAQDTALTAASFRNLNLAYPGLETVSQLVTTGKYDQAARELLTYYRQRTNIKHPEYNLQDKASYAGKPISKEVLEKADKALLHQFQPQKGYGFYDYGKDINWQYWPVKDNEVRWQLHRVYWWQPMGLAYWSTGDEKYAKEWVFQFDDWVRKNPLGLSAENDSFAWRPLEISERLQSLTGTFNLFVSATSFTPRFLLEFLNSYSQQAAYIPDHYTKVGNHLLFEAQRMIYAGCFFPELKNASAWKKSGIEVLNREIQKQVYEDGMQFELSPSYHNASIDIFLKALRMAQLNGGEDDFPTSYKKTIEHMIFATINFSFPDYTFPMFGDSWLVTKNAMLKQYQSWYEAFPENPVIQYYATDGNKGQQPSFLSQGLTKAGFYTFRNGWDMRSTVLVLKASPPGEFHAQPDNGTFELWVKGRNFMPDAGCYVYSGDEEINKMRNWYRQTRVHQTLTLDNKNMNITNATLLNWKPDANPEVLTYTNPSYDHLTHKRSVLFIDHKFFLIIDQANGTAAGNLGVHFQLKEDSHPVLDTLNNKVYTTFPDENNLLIQSLGKQHCSLSYEEGKVSYAYRKEITRPAFVFGQHKTMNDAPVFITILLPYEGKTAPQVSIKENTGNNYSNGTINLKLTIDRKSYDVKRVL
ncbi:heparin-sulfate lyase HepC [Chitinophaga sp. RAB17]|uniref:heparin-sulfate lyase HepC n=1 Tax=Chitinophaga sp. RAB17 TaxID=3233049 RepID=UPI003F932D26